MKKYFSLFLCLCLLVSLVACSKNTDTTPDEGKNDPTNPSVDDTPTDPTEEPDNKPKYRLLQNRIFTARGNFSSTDQYHYNADGMLVRISSKVNHTSAEYTVECDSNGNPVKYVSKDRTCTCEYNKRGQIIRYSYSLIDTTYTYDDNGNVLSINTHSVGGGSETRNNIWEDGVLVKTEITRYGTKEYILYTYDEEGREIKTETYNSKDELRYYTETQYEEGESTFTETTLVLFPDGTLQETHIRNYEKVS